MEIKPLGRNCVQGSGYSLHANTRVAELDRAGLEKLCQYVCRLAIAAHRLEQVDAQTIRISLNNEWAAIAPRHRRRRAARNPDLGPRQGNTHSPYQHCRSPPHELPLSEVTSRHGQPSWPS